MISDNARRAAEEIAEEHISDFCVKVDDKKGESWPCICDYRNIDCEIIASIEAIILRHCGNAEQELKQRIEVLENACKKAHREMSGFSIPMPFYSAFDHFAGLRSALQVVEEALHKNARNRHENP